MLKTGMIIAERYEILGKIGTGGMADVYKAKDHKLNRFVAVKVLKPEFREDTTFIRKFRSEAQAAAGLTHPNIVNVFDVGDDEGVYYIVMELIEGITLKEYIAKKGKLSIKEATSIAIQVSMGLEAAHNHGIVHRDVKPQNIIISTDGKVKVTDFGIARAASSNTISSNVMGSVHYSSPEQVRGGYSDEKSDIYSLGITMFEMLTGRVPFNGETTVAIAIKHIQEEMPSPKEFVPEIPSSVASIVLKCCQKSPDRRYQNMAELIADLKQSLINPEEDFVVNKDPDMEGGTRMISDEDMAQIKRKVPYQSGREYEEQDHDETMRLRSDTEAMYENDEEGEDDYDYDPKMERVTTVLAIVAGVVICIILIVLAVKIFGGKKNEGNNPSGPIITTEETKEEAEKVTMPDVKGMNVDDARNTLTGLGILTEVVYEESDSVAEGVVISTDVSAGAQIDKGSKVTLTASAGTQGVEVPNVVGLTFDEANTQLVSKGFLVNKTEDYSDTIEAGRVIAQTPADGNKAPKGSVITVTVSLGKEDTKIRVPNLIGLSEQDGTVEAIEAGLTVGSVTHIYSDEVGEGMICYQSYSHGSYVDQGTSIDIKVSQGAQKVTYKCNVSIAAPTTSEAPKYVSGMEVGITLVADDGTVLMDTKVTTFPVATNINGIASSGGTLTMTYQVTTEGTTTEGDVVVPGTTENQSFTRRVEFVKE
ncbi:MAG: Stk1 family PASTA domain-containing Ser/Thr kinase [Blautia obeum]|nr:Stk1 family PASTA domain-containing Ser/Thr kinase [Blautia obeum]